MSDPWVRNSAGTPKRTADGRKVLKPLPEGIEWTWRRNKDREWLRDADGDRVPADRYRCRANARTTPPGQTRYQLGATFDTLAEAKKWLADVRSGVIDWTPPPEPEKPVETVNGRLDLWLATRRKVRPVTLRGYSDASRHWRSAFGDIPTTDLARVMVEERVNELLATGLSPRTIGLALTVLRSAMKEAVQEGVIPRNPTALVTLPKAPDPDKRAWTPGQAGAFLTSVADDRLAGCWWLTMMGLRRSEVLGLRWSDIDWDAGTVSIARSRVMVGVEHVGEPKTTRSTRTLPVDGAVRDALTRLRALRSAECLRLGVGVDPESYLAVDEAQKPLRPERYSDLWAKAVAACPDVPRLTLHEARHTAATLLMAAGVPLDIAAEWLGHDPAVLLKTYNHPTRERIASAGSALGAAFAS